MREAFTQGRLRPPFFFAGLAAGFGFPLGPGLDSALCGFGGMLSMRAIIRLASSRSLSSAMKSPEKMPLLHLGIPLSPDDYKQVGQITAMFGYIEMYVDMTMLHLLKIRSMRTFDTLMAGKNSGSKVSLLKQLVTNSPLKEGALKEAIGAFCERHNQIVGDRHLAVHGIWHIDPIKNVVQAHSWKRRTQPMERKQLPKVVLQTEELSRLAFRMWGTIFWPGRDLSNMVYMFAGHQARKPVKRAVEKWLGRSFQPVRAQRPKNLPSPGRSSKDEAQPTPRAPRPRKG
ncbi:MAG: hypothetical protein ACJ8DU_13640 [Microvirga sp.]